MTEQIGPWILTVMGLAGFYLVGKKRWWAWYINVANQILWWAYAIFTEQWGFLAGALAYTIIFSKNAIEWTRAHWLEQERRRKKAAYAARVEMLRKKRP